MTPTAKLIWLVTPALVERDEAEAAVVEAARNVFEAAAGTPEQRSAPSAPHAGGDGVHADQPGYWPPEDPDDIEEGDELLVTPTDRPGAGSVSATARLAWIEPPVCAAIPRPSV
jgi:hypothetical protein